MVFANNVITNVPLYAIIIGSVLAGVVLSWIISGLNAWSVYRKLRGKEKVIEQDQKQIHSLEDKVAHLESENAQLKSDLEERSAPQHVEFEEEHQERKPSFFYNLFHPRTEHR